MTTTFQEPVPAAIARDDATARDAPQGWSATLRDKPGLGMAGLLIVAMVVGYEWFVSGVVKFIQGDFPTGLADELLTKSADAPAWYASFLTGDAIRYAEPFGYVIETTELLAGVALILGPIIWLLAWHRVSDRIRLWVLFFVAFSALGGAFLAINLHLANGATHPWLLPGDAFDEGIDLDSVLPAISLVIAAVSIITFRRLRRTTPDSLGTGAISTVPRRT